MSRAALLFVALLIGCGSGTVADSAVPVFENDPLYATCLVSTDDPSLCAADQTLYVCYSHPVPLTHGCTSAVEAAPPLVLPQYLVCCPSHGSVDGGGT